MRHVLPACVLAGLGCVHASERALRFEDTNRLTPGASTRADAERLFGPPRAVKAGSEGSVDVIWTGFSTGPQVLTLSFRPDGSFERVVRKDVDDVATTVPGAGSMTP